MTMVHEMESALSRRYWNEWNINDVHRLAHRAMYTIVTGCKTKSSKMFNSWGCDGPAVGVRQPLQLNKYTRKIDLNSVHNVHIASVIFVYDSLFFIVCSLKYRFRLVCCRLPPAFIILPFFISIWLVCAVVSFNDFLTTCAIRFIYAYISLFSWCVYFFFFFLFFSLVRYQCIMQCNTMNGWTKKKKGLIESRVQMNRRIVLHLWFSYKVFHLLLQCMPLFHMIKSQFFFYFTRSFCSLFVMPSGVLNITLWWLVRLHLNIRICVCFFSALIFSRVYVFCSHIWTYYTSHICVNYFARAYLIQGYNRAHIQFRWTRLRLFCTHRLSIIPAHTLRHRNFIQFSFK